MALRKEQVLLLVALALGAWVWKGQAGAEWRAPSLTTTKIEYKVAPLPKAPLLSGAAAQATSRRWFREPSETQPLPPRELPFPQRPPANLVALPLDPGPDLSRADLLLIPGDVVPDVTLQPTAAAPAAPAATDEAPKAQGNETADEKRRRFGRIYDEIKVDGIVHMGVLRVPGRDLYELERANDFSGVVAHLLEFSLQKEKLIAGEVTFGSDARQKIESIKLADSLRNTVARKTREVPEAAAYVAQRLELIDWLLLQARQDGSVYAEALHQVEVLKQTGAGLLAARAQARVCYVRGDVAGEFAVYRGVTDAAGPGAAFRHEGLGSLESRLGLYEDAETDLRRAVELQPTDARPHATLAMFLRQRGRPKEAGEVASRALATAGTVVEVLERARILRNVVACRLGTGDIAGAREAMGGAIQLADWREADAFTSFLRASIDYADGKIAEARDGFRTASGAGHGPLSQLGFAACQLRLGEWQDALAGFEAVADQAPLLRHRALTGIALLYLRLGQNDQALAHVDRALEADPFDAYALYLRARAQAAQGQIASALEALTGSNQQESAVLRLRDDFVPAVSMVADLRLRMFDEGEAQDQAGNALAAIRYADRAVQLSAVPRVPLFERQAIAHFRGADLRAAGDAFAQARDAAADEPSRLFALAGLVIVDYAQEHVDEARGQLERMQQDLPRENPMRQWAADTMLKIDDHAHKEQLDDHFERDETGTIWKLQLDPLCGPKVEDHHLVFQGKFSKAGTEVSVTREKAVLKGGQFLAVGCRMQVGAGHGPDSFAGLRILVKGTTNNEIRAEVGAREGKLFWRIQEGRDEPLQSPNTTDPVGTGMHQLELRVEERGDKQFRLLVVVDGVVVQRKDMTLLRATEGRELETAMVAIAGSRPGAVDVRFDDYHLERRKD